MAIDFYQSRDSSRSKPAPWGSVRSGSAAGCFGLRCLFLVVVVSRPGPDASFFFVLRKRFLNLGGRCRTADQAFAYLTLAPPRPGNGIPHHQTSDECVARCVGNQRVFPMLQDGMDDSAGFPGDALDEADSLEVTIASAECADCGGLRYSLRRYGFQSFFPDMPCMKRVYRDRKASFHWSAARNKERFSSR